MAYEVGFHKQAKKQLQGLSREHQERALRRIRDLQNNPRPNGCKKLRGKGNDPVYRIRSGSYRVIYTVDDISMIVYILAIKHRKDAY